MTGFVSFLEHASGYILWSVLIWGVGFSLWFMRRERRITKANCQAGRHRVHPSSVKAWEIVKGGKTITIGTCSDCRSTVTIRKD